MPRVMPAASVQLHVVRDPGGVGDVGDLARRDVDRQRDEDRVDRLGERLRQRAGEVALLATAVRHRLRVSRDVLRRRAVEVAVQADPLLQGGDERVGLHRRPRLAREVGGEVDERLGVLGVGVVGPAVQRPDRTVARLHRHERRQRPARPGGQDVVLRGDRRVLRLLVDGGDDLVTALEQPGLVEPVLREVLLDLLHDVAGRPVTPRRAGLARRRDLRERQARRLRLGQPVLLGHAADDVVPPSLRRVRVHGGVVVRRRADERREHRALRHVELARRPCRSRPGRPPGCPRLRGRSRWCSGSPRGSRPWSAAATASPR